MELNQDIVNDSWETNKWNDKVALNEKFDYFDPNTHCMNTQMIWFKVSREWFLGTDSPS